VKYFDVVSWAQKLYYACEDERKLEVFQEALASICLSSKNSLNRLEGVKVQIPKSGYLTEFPMSLKHLSITTSTDEQGKMSEILSYISPHASTLTDCELFLSMTSYTGREWVPPGNVMLPRLPELRRLVLAVHASQEYGLLECANALNLRKIFLVSKRCLRYKTTNFDTIV